MTQEFQGGIDAIFHYLDDHATADEIRWFLMAVETKAATWKFRADTLAHQKHEPVMGRTRDKEMAH